MQMIATITSKRQLTIPVSLYKKMGFSDGQKVMVQDRADVIEIRSASGAVEKLAGSVAIPKRFKGLTTQEIINKAKSEYFSNRNKA
jgi:bifunctional DNA-binding transcriptional regulator/antitoxin component of YhaV-PrlF toxin-antitoxin module